MPATVIAVSSLGTYAAKKSYSLSVVNDVLRRIATHVNRLR